MSNKKHEEFEKKNEKWRKASNKAIDLRYALDDVISSFSEEEKQSLRYKQFIRTVSDHFDHLLGDINKKRIEEEQSKVVRIQKKNGWMSYKSAIIAAGGAVIVQIVQSLPQIISAISSLFGGTP
jgi:histone deacetylase complex regulatory component SIN3